MLKHLPKYFFPPHYGRAFLALGELFHVYTPKRLNRSALQKTQERSPTAGKLWQVSICKRLSFPRLHAHGGHTWLTFHPLLFVESKKAIAGPCDGRYKMANICLELAFCYDTRKAFWGRPPTEHAFIHLNGIQCVEDFLNEESRCEPFPFWPCKRRPARYC